MAQPSPPPHSQVESSTAPPLALATGPLSGLRVIELGQLIAGPFCGQLLGDMGADVVKVEPPGLGDPMRQWGQGEIPVWWEVIARNKRSVTLNLRVPAGQALARLLIGEADIVIENFRPGTMEKWNLSPASLLQENPRLILVRISGYGQTGPYASRSGFGGIGEAMAGWRRIVGEPDRPPARMGISIGDTLAGMCGCLGALSALHHRQLSGKGQIVDAALYESVLQVMEGLVAEFSVSGHIRERFGSMLPGIAPSNAYHCRDGEFLIGANQDTVFARLCQAMGQAELARDARFATHAARGRHQVELDQLIDQWTRTLTVRELDELMVKHCVPAGGIYAAPDMLADKHFQARGAIESVAHPRYPGLQMQSVFPKLSLTPGSIHRIAPQVPGQDNAVIYAETAGLGEAQMAELHAAGVI